MLFRSFAQTQSITNLQDTFSEIRQLLDLFMSGDEGFEMVQQQQHQQQQQQQHNNNHQQQQQHFH